MRFGRRRHTDALLSVVVPAYGVEDYLDPCLDSILASTHRHLDVIVVDDGSPDASGDIAEERSRADDRIRVVHIENRGLGGARNEGLRHIRGEFVAFADSDDIVPPTAYATMLAALLRSESDFVTGSIVRLEAEALVEPPWMRRLHAVDHGRRISIEDHPEVLGDVFAWNKIFRRSFWDERQLSWPEGVRYEDQPTTTRAFLDGRFDVLPDIVYQWRVRDDGTSITQQRGSLTDLNDRIVTKRMALSAVRDHDVAAVTDTFIDRVLAGDMWRYFCELPGCTDEWWQLLHTGVTEFWGDRSLVHSGLPPVHRLTGWLIEQDRRADATRVMEYVGNLAGAPAPRLTSADGKVLLDLPPDVLDSSQVAREALLIRHHER